MLRREIDDLVAAVRSRTGDGTVGGPAVRPSCQVGGVAPTGDAWPWSGGRGGVSALRSGRCLREARRGGVPIDDD